MSVEGIVLAAGFSSRAGTNKLLLELGGQSILARCVETMSQVCRRVIVVGGHRYRDTEAAIAGLPGVDLIYNENYPKGMFSSVLKGIRQVRAERFFLCPGDYPLIQKQTYLDLLARDGTIIVPSYQGRSGHPVLINTRLVPAIINGEHDNLRSFIKTNRPLLVEVDDPGILTDIDTMADYKDIVQGYDTIASANGYLWVPGNNFPISYYPLWVQQSDKP